MRSKLRLSNGEESTPPFKVPKSKLQCKGCGFTHTTRRLAQKQPSFKESVTAHWSSGTAPTMYGTKFRTEDAGVPTLRRDAVEERCIWAEGEEESLLDCTQVRMLE